MRIFQRNYGVLKLVHPGRHVEVFYQPIIAGEIMNKYPRHCIARPDVFEFPWIVVYPASLLVPGQMFLLVPYRKVYDLLKSNARRLDRTLASSKHSHFPQLDKDNLTSQSQESYEAMERQGSDSGSSSNRFISYDTWNDVRGNVNQPEENYHDDQPEDSRLKPCLRKKESDRKKHSIKVIFSSQAAVGRPHQ